MPAAPGPLPRPGAPGSKGHTHDRATHMTVCSRACCWTPLACAKRRACPCHKDETTPTSRNNGGTVYRDPTAQQAVSNIMANQRRTK